jgi:hypothetical protein
LRTAGSRDSRRGRRPWLAGLGGFAVAGVALFVLYLAQSSRGTYVTSDGASNALQAWAMLHGNLLLRGWALSDVAFYTTELPEYMLVEAVHGLGSEVVHICAALTYTLLVLLAAALAKGRATGREGVIRALVAAGIMLAPELGDPSGVLLLSPDHVGTGVPLLVTWLLVDRGATWQGAAGKGAAEKGAAGKGVAKRDSAGESPPEEGAGWGWRWGSRYWLVPVLVGFILAWTAVADQLAEVIGALPLALVCAFRVGQGLWPSRRAGQRRRWRGLRWRDLRWRGLGWRELRWYELSLLVAAVVSVPLAKLATRAISAAGGWSLNPVRTSVGGTGVLGQRAYLTGMGILQLFGADFLGRPTAWQTAIAYVHLAGVALAAAGLCLAVRRFWTTELVIQVLVIAIAVNIAAYLATVQAQDIKNTREIAAVLPFGAVLAGRLLAGRLLAPGRLAAAAAITAGAVLAGYGASLGYDIGQPPVPDQPASIASWLTAHRLTRGLGGYWEANVVTLDTGGSVQVRAIDVGSGGQAVSGTYWEADRAWYDPATQYADFVVDTPPLPWNPGYPGPLVRSMEATAGKPARLYFYDGFSIAVWKLNLLTRLG